MQSSLVRGHTKRSFQSWGPKERRTYQRLLSGLHRSRSLGERVRIITLTSPPWHSRTPAGGRQLAKNWQLLRRRIARRYGKLEYFRLRTDEGFGVLHIVYRGPYIPHRFLKRSWTEIHGAEIVYIQALRGKSRRIAGYLVGHYLAGHHSFMRQSWSWGWVFRGFVRSWRRTLDGSNSLADAIVKWKCALGVQDPESWLKEHRKKKRWVDGSAIDEALKEYPNLYELSLHRLEMVVRYFVHHPKADPSQTKLYQFGFKAHRG